MEKEKVIQDIMNKIPCNPIMLSMCEDEGMSAEVKIKDVKVALSEAYEAGLNRTKESKR